ncbi:hypothetical protein O181_089151 [Austropuccinia psidii MF-1]|uniref:Uncharacterized protein n=1 Tax=Austropuccinia psidii MF-1 TaxID=1389203 RepID=A0A9Q3IT19_9BASI|nr:hypothetical protein [Austropuccinia psidii MF-1]
MTNACDAFLQAQKRCSLVAHPFLPCTRCSCEESFVVNNDKSIHERKWTLRPQTGKQEHFGTISPVPLSIDLCTSPRPPSNGHFTPLWEQTDYLDDEGWQWKEEIPTWADCRQVL